LPPNAPFLIVGGSTFESEVADVFELGYRGQLSSAFTYSITAYHYEWDQLRSGQLPPAQVQNKIQGTTDGIEFWGAWQVLQSWRLSGGFSTFSQDLRTEPGAGDPTGPSALGNDPNYQWQIRSSFNFPAHQELDIMLRRVAALPDPVVPAYNAVDIRYGWKVRPDLELSATVQNLLDPDHAEFNAASGRSEFERGVFLKARWTY
jgi:iron complex outermembrane receptor protein